MSKIKEELRLKMLGQLSHDKTELDVNNAYEVVKESVLSFSIFLRENYSTQERWENIELEYGIWRDWRTDRETTIEEIFEIWEDGTEV